MKFEHGYEELQAMMTSAWRRGRRVGLREGAALGFIVGCLAGLVLR